MQLLPCRRVSFHFAGFWIFPALFIFWTTATSSFADDKKVKICFENWPPYYEADQTIGALGPVPEVLRDISMELGLEPSFHVMPFKRCLGELRINHSQVALLLDEGPHGLNIGRTALAFWSVGAIVPKNMPDSSVSSLQALNGKRVLMIGDYIYPKAIREAASGWKSVKVNYAIEATPEAVLYPFRMVETGRVDLFLEDIYWAEQIIRQHGLQLKTVQPALVRHPSFLGYAPAASDLQIRIETALAARARDGRLEKLYQDMIQQSWQDLSDPIN